MLAHLSGAVKPRIALSQILVPPCLVPPRDDRGPGLGGSSGKERVVALVNRCGRRGGTVAGAWGCGVACRRVRVGARLLCRVVLLVIVMRAAPLPRVVDFHSELHCEKERGSVAAIGWSDGIGWGWCGVVWDPKVGAGTCRQF